jgi:hypothetical protein
VKAVSIAIAMTALLAVAASPAGAASDAQALREAGLRIAWPQETRMLAGEQVAVGVRATAARLRSGRRVRVALLGLSSTGRPIRVVAARRMRSGRFTAALPNASTERRYLLAVDADGRRYSRRIVAMPPPPPPPPPPAPPQCAQAPSAVEMSLDRAAAQRSERFAIRFRNTGATCLTYGADYLFERLTDDGRWEPAGEPRPFPAWAAGVAPGETAEIVGFVWEELEPGTYRVVKSFLGPDATVTATARLDIR